MYDLILTKALPDDEHPAFVYLNKLSEGGRRAANQSLVVIAAVYGATDVRSLNWGGLRYKDTVKIRAALTQMVDESGESVYKFTTVNKMLAALRSTLREAWKLGQMNAEEYHLAVSIENIKGESLPRGRSLSAGEIISLVGACEIDHTNSGVRDMAIIAILFSCGLRRAELVGLDPEHFDPETGKITILNGKGNKDRECFVRNGGKAAVIKWLAIRGDEAGKLFTPINKSGKIRLDPMTTNAVYNMLRKRGDQAGLRRFSPHDLRRTLISNMLEITDVITVQKFVGHSDPKTTALYDRRGDKAKEDAADQIHFPYRGRQE